MRFRLTPRERTMLIAAAAILVLAAFLLGVIDPLHISIDKQTEELSVAQADLQLAREADASSAAIAQRLTEVTNAWQALQLPEGDHQASLVREVDRLRQQTGVSIESIGFGASAVLESASSLLANGQVTVQGAAPAPAAGQLQLAMTVSGSQAACVDFIGRVESLPDVVILSAGFRGENGVTATLSGYLIQTPGK